MFNSFCVVHLNVNIDIANKTRNEPNNAHVHKSSQFRLTSMVHSAILLLIIERMQPT